MREKSTKILFFLSLCFVLFVVGYQVRAGFKSRIFLPNKVSPKSNPVLTQVVSSSPAKKFTGEPINLLSLGTEELNYISSGDGNNTVYTKDNIRREVVYENHRVFSIQLSPTKNRLAFLYYPNDDVNHLAVQVLAIFQGKYQKMYGSDLASWEATGALQWLGNDHIFFTNRCGTGCQGLILVDIESKKTWSGVLTFMSSIAEGSFDGSWQTHFTDWFGHDSQFNGFIKKMNSEMKNGSVYLVFSMEGEKGENLPAKRFLFRKDSLTLL